MTDVPDVALHRFEILGISGRKLGVLRGYLRFRLQDGEKSHPIRGAIDGIDDVTNVDLRGRWLLLRARH